MLKVKRDGRKKTRGIIKGFHMQQGIDYNETFAPVPVTATIRLMFAIAAKFDWEIKQGDAKTAFLGSDLDTELYILVPKWFSADPDPDATGYTIHQVLKGIPGIPQGPRLFHKKSHWAVLCTSFPNARIA